MWHGYGTNAERVWHGCGTSVAEFTDRNISVEEREPLEKEISHTSDTEIISTLADANKPMWEETGVVVVRARGRERKPW